jgi:hypothetical protein
MPEDGAELEPVYCIECGSQIGRARSPNSELRDTGEVAAESHLQAVVNSPMASINVILQFVCDDCDTDTDSNGGDA